MEIVVNTNSLLTPLTGIGQYTYQLSKALKEIDAVNRYTYYYGFYSGELFCPRENKDSSQARSEQLKLNAYKRIKQAVKKIPVIGPMGRELRTSISKTIQFIKRRKFDLYVEPNFIPLGEIRSGKIVTMVFDLSVVLHPEWHPQERVEIFRRYFKKGLKRSDVVLTATQFIKNQIVNELHIPESKICVTPIACNSDIFRPLNKNFPADSLKSISVPKQFLLFVGSIEPRKNILTLLKAYLQLPEHLRRELFIVFCGPSGWKNDDVFRFVKTNGLEEKIIQTNYILDEALSVLYNKAIALVYPSFYEGFGLPPLEAMSCGCPVIASDIPPHKELCGDAVLYVDPRSPEQLSSKIMQLLSDEGLKNSLKEKGLMQAKKFNWQKTAADTLKIFNSLT